MVLHPTQLARRAAAGQPGGVQVHIFRCVHMFCNSEEYVFICFVIFRKRLDLLPFHTMQLTAIVDAGLLQALV